MQERFGAISGGPLSSSIALATFVSLFPLLLVLIAVVGFLSAGRTDFTSDVISELGLQGEAAQAVEDAIVIAEGSRRAASILGLVGLLWAGLAVVGAMQAAFNAAWQVTGRGLVDRLVAVRWLLGAGTLFLVTAALGPAISWLPGWLALVDIAVGAAITTAAVPLDVHHPHQQQGRAGARTCRARSSWPLGFEILKVVGAVYVPRLVSGSSALYGSIGVVFATLAWLAIYARLIVHGAVLNVVRYETAAGTVTVEIEVPRIEGEVPLSANRGGAVEERAQAPGFVTVGRSALSASLPRACPVRADILVQPRRRGGRCDRDSHGPGRDDRKGNDAGTDSCNSRSGRDRGTGGLRALGALLVAGPAGQPLWAALRQCSRRHRPPRLEPGW